MEIEKNIYLKNHIKYLNILSFDYPVYFINFCKDKNIPLNNNKLTRTIIDWDQVIPYNYSLYYDFIDCEINISEKFKYTPIANYESIIIEFGYDLPIVLVDSKIFINHWYDFISANNFLGITCVVPDGKYFFEFTDDTDYLLKSNFKIGNVMD